MSALDLRMGDFREVMQDVSCDLLCVDAPYSERTHAGHVMGSKTTAELQAYKASRPGKVTATTMRASLNYEHWTPADVQQCVDFWAPRTRGWMVSITDHLLATAWEAAMASHNRYTFAPLPILEVGKQPRLTGDGPASWTCWVVVSRPKTRAFAGWGSLPGGYTTERKDQDRIPGGKPLWLMRALVRDYSRPGDLVCDPCGGGFTTALAAVMEGRRAVSSEMDAATFAKGKARLDRGWTLPMQFDAPAPGVQGGLLK